MLPEHPIQSSAFAPDRRTLLGNVDQGATADELGACPVRRRTTSSADCTWWFTLSCELNVWRTMPSLSMTKVTRPGRKPRVEGTPNRRLASEFKSDKRINGNWCFCLNPS